MTGTKTKAKPSPASADSCPTVTAPPRVFFEVGSQVDNALGGGGLPNAVRRTPTPETAHVCAWTRGPAATGNEQPRNAAMPAISARAKSGGKSSERMVADNPHPEPMPCAFWAFRRVRHMSGISRCVRLPHVCAGPNTRTGAGSDRRKHDQRDELPLRGGESVRCVTTSSLASRPTASPASRRGSEKAKSVCRRPGGRVQGVRACATRCRHQA